MSPTTTDLGTETSPTPQRGKMSNVRWFYVVLPLLFVWIVAQWDKANISVLFASSAFIRDTHISGPAVEGIIGAVLGWFYAVAQLFWGFSVQKVGARVSAVLGCILWTIGMSVGAMASSVGALIWFRAILGTGEGYSYPVSLSYSANWFPLKERARAQSIWFSGVSIGPAIGMPLLGIVIVAWGWRASMWIFALSSLVAALVIWLATRDHPSQHPACNAAEVAHIDEDAAVAETDETATGSLSVLLKSVPFWLASIVCGFGAMAYWGSIIFLPSFLSKAKGITFMHSVLITAASFVVSLGAMYFAGWLSDRTMRRTPIIIISYICSIVTILLSVTGGPAMAAVMQILTIAFLDGGAVLILAMAQHIIGRHHIARGTGVFMLLAQLIGAFGPMLVGYLAGVGGFSIGMGSIAVVVLVPIIGTLILQQGYRVDSLNRG